jgi:hypothetical protein
MQAMIESAMAVVLFPQLLNINPIGHCCLVLAVVQLLSAVEGRSLQQGNFTNT